MFYDIIMLGHVSKDILVDHTGVESRLLGGAIVHSAISAAKAGARVLAITKTAPEDAPSVGFIRESGAELIVGSSPATTSILNVFRTADHERRDTTLLSRAAPFRASDIPADARATIIDMAGLFVGELPDSLIEELSGRAKIAVDAQGLLRNAMPDKTMKFIDWNNKRRFLPLVTYLKTDAAEAEILTGLQEREAAARVLASWGAKEVMVTHNSEVIVLVDGKIYCAPFTPSNLSGRTGRGDTTFSSYLARRLTHEPGDAVRFAAALCSIKMEKPGPFAGTIDEVYARMERDSRQA
ncbi:MAG: PfkB family carbohydrate kinase [Rectinemataceae bacterium]|nr:PfkB family carbohydrate kinase [Rectinemataceae bacterium]